MRNRRSEQVSPESWNHTDPVCKTSLKKLLPWRLSTGGPRFQGSRIGATVSGQPDLLRPHPTSSRNRPDVIDRVTLPDVAPPCPGATSNALTADLAPPIITVARRHGCTCDAPLTRHRLADNLVVLGVAHAADCPADPTPERATP